VYGKKRKKVTSFYKPGREIRIVSTEGRGLTVVDRGDRTYQQGFRKGKKRVGRSQLKGGEGIKRGESCRF